MISVGHCSALVVAAEINFDDVPRVSPIGMMVLFLGQSSNFGHEHKGFCEVGELKSSVQRIVLLYPTRGHV
jgi:hypothetical protein